MRITASLLRFSTTLALAVLLVSEEAVYVQAASSDSGYGLDIPFNPREYTKHTTQCKAIKRDAGGKNDEIVDISLSEWASELILSSLYFETLTVITYRLCRN